MLFAVAELLVLKLRNGRMLFSMYANMLSFIQNAHHNGRQCRPELKSIDERGYFLRCTNTVFSEYVHIKKDKGVLE